MVKITWLDLASLTITVSLTFSCAPAQKKPSDIMVTHAGVQPGAPQHRFDIGRVGPNRSHDQNSLSLGWHGRHV
jgi:hypothetical protein